MEVRIQTEDFHGRTPVEDVHGMLTILIGLIVEQSSPISIEGSVGSET